MHSDFPFIHVLIFFFHNQHFNDIKDYPKLGEEQRMRNVPIHIDRVRRYDNTNTTHTGNRADGVKTPVTDILGTFANR